MKNTDIMLNHANEPLISVIVPVYNVEKYLARCVDSILAQTYENLEIILVNDGSTDDSANVINQYVEQDGRVVRLDHEKNRGLFQTRITGAEAAHGEYVAFVDSDDYISIDWFRMLVEKAEETQSDIVVGEWCFDNNGKSKTYLNLDPFRIKDFNLTGDAVLDAFMEQEGRCFSWTVVWNKLYRHSLWESCESEYCRFSKEHGHMLMWEDIAFSSALWARAQKVTNVHHINYYYFRHPGASTGVNKNRKRNEKYISDASAALVFMKSQLEAVGAYSRTEAHYLSWRNRGAALVYNDIVVSWGLKRLEKPIRDAFSIEKDFVEHEEFFYKDITQLAESSEWFEDIKKQICSPKTKVVSFDVFDTLVSRPFLEPSDLFDFLSGIFNKDTAAYVDFPHIRMTAEEMSRFKKRVESPSVEEVTLDEIYAQIQALMPVSSETLQSLKQKEIELELKLCKVRECGRELYRLAQFAGKRIVICSDMYLPLEVIEAILTNNGYRGWENLYLSSELGKTKYSGRLYRHMLKDLGIRDGKQVLHIGDNWRSDVESAQRSRIQSLHLPRASEVIRNYNPSIYGGGLYTSVLMQNRGIEDYALMMQDYPAARCMLALSANKFFDNPYVSINAASDFNGNPACIGYAALGPHLMALAQWIESRAVARKVGTVHFVARDGYMVKRAFDVLNQSSVQSNYIRLSRSALILADINSPIDLYSLRRKINTLHCSPKKLMRYLSPLIPKEKMSAAREILEDNKFKWDSTFNEEREFYRCLDFIIEEMIDFSLLPEYKEKLREYFSNIIKPGDAIFDIGYSGRPEAALSNLLGFPVGSFYIHENSDIASKRQRRYGCHNECFYPYKPKITGVMREHLLMEMGPSTIGYAETDGVFQPVFEEYEKEYCSAFVTSIIQESAMQYIKDFLAAFGDLRDYMEIPQSIQSVAFEYYLHYSKPFDRVIFASLPFEDFLGEGQNLKALDFWNKEIVARGVWQSDSPQGVALPAEFNDLYLDGLFVKMYRKINKWFPKGGRKRVVVKKIASVFIH